MSLERGYEMQKFFPAEASGGTHAIQSIGGPLPQISFCPTGGIKADTAKAYLAQANVTCVGGSWMTPDSLLNQQNWPEIEALAKSASALG